MLSELLQESRKSYLLDYNTKTSFVFKLKKTTVYANEIQYFYSEYKRTINLADQFDHFDNSSILLTYPSSQRIRGDNNGCTVVSPKIVYIYFAYRSLKGPAVRDEHNAFVK